MVRVSNHTMVSMVVGEEKLSHNSTILEFRHYLFGGLTLQTTPTSTHLLPTNDLLEIKTRYVNIPR